MDLGISNDLAIPRLITSFNGTSRYSKGHPLCRLARTSQQFIVPEGLLECSQGPCTGPYPEPEQSSPHNLFPSPQDPKQYYLPIILCLPSDPIPSGFPSNIFRFLFDIHATCLVNLILINFIVLIILDEL
jgi:hypothetical protein